MESVARFLTFIFTNPPEDKIYKKTQKYHVVGVVLAYLLDHYKERC